MEEIWKYFEGKYQISNLGRIKNSKAGKILKLRKNHRGYLKTNISINGKLKTVFPHRLVAQAFIPNPNNLPEVNHMDEVKENNYVNNLEWCTNIYNANYGTAIERRASKTRKRVKQYSINDEYIKTFESLTKAAEDVKGNTGGICRCCKGKRPTAYGYKWKYAD